jgi:hypothetical protein
MMVFVKDVYKICSKTVKTCGGTCKKESIPADLPKSLSIKAGAGTWHKVSSLSELRSVLSDLGDVSYKLVAGNTAEGATSF